MVNAGSVGSEEPRTTSWDTPRVYIEGKVELTDRMYTHDESREVHGGSLSESES